MRIKSIAPSLQNLALARPYTIARETVTDVESAFLAIELDNGIVGLGAANPSPEVVGEGPAESFANLQSAQLQELLVGKDVRHFMRLIDAVNAAFPHKPGTLAAVDIALHDAFGKLLDIPVVEFYGQYHRELPTSVTIGIKNVQETLEEAQEYYERGFRILKVKTGLDAAEDAERILKLREQYGNHFRIRVDANQGYNLEQLRYFVAQTAGAGLELIEQPIHEQQEQVYDALDASTRRMLCADESLHDPAAALRLAAHPQRFGIFNIKLMKCGGIRGAMGIASIAQPAGIDLFWGCNDESLVSITAALHAAFACPHTRYLDLDGSLDLAKDAAVGGFILENGMMRPGPGAGLGIQPL